MWIQAIVLKNDAGYDIDQGKWQILARDGLPWTSLLRVLESHLLILFKPRRDVHSGTMKHSAVHVDDDSGHSPSDDEKKIGVEAGAFENAGHHELPPDPDEGLSDAEKARIV